MKVTLTYDDDGPDGADEMRRAKLALNAHLYKSAFEDVWDRCFRPNNKHGYQNKLLEDGGSYDVIEELEKIYAEIREELYTDIEN